MIAQQNPCLLPKINGGATTRTSPLAVSTYNSKAVVASSHHLEGPRAESTLLPIDPIPVLHLTCIGQRNPRDDGKRNETRSDLCRDRAGRAARRALHSRRLRAPLARAAAGRCRHDARRIVKIAIGIFRLLPRGGLEDHALRIADELARRGHEVTLHTTGKLPDVDVGDRLAGPAPKALDQSRPHDGIRGRLQAGDAGAFRSNRRLSADAGHRRPVPCRSSSQPSRCIVAEAPVATISHLCAS